MIHTLILTFAPKRIHMKYYRISYLLVLCVTIIACNNDQTTTENETEAVDLKEALQGTWQTTQLTVAVNSVDGLDSFRVDELTERVWETDFGMKPPVYYFQPDQKFRKEHKTLAGELMNESRGVWNVFGDTLMLIEPEVTYQYTVKLSSGRMAFRTLLDWDEDGVEDDEYQCVFRQISISTN